MTNPEPIDICVFGLGAVGTVYSWILENSTEARVTAIARSNCDVVKEKGIFLNSEKFGEFPEWRPYRVVGSPEEAADRPYAFVVCTFKCLPDVFPTDNLISPLLKTDTLPTIVLIQNGIGIEKPVQEAYPDLTIISTVAWIGANSLQSGAVVEHGLLEKLVIGLYKGEERKFTGGGISGTTTFEPVISDEEKGKREEGRKRVDRFAELLEKGGGDVEVADDIQPARWSKNMWNAGWSTICALSRATVGDVCAPEVLPHTLPVVRRSMLEVLYVARALGYGEDVLPARSVDNAIKVTVKNYQLKVGTATPGTPGASADVWGGVGPNRGPPGSGSHDTNPLSQPVSPTFSRRSSTHRPGPSGSGSGSLTKGFKPSMLIDLESGRPMELEPIIGAVLDRARMKAIETPRLDLIYSSLKISQEKIVRGMARKFEENGDSEDHLHRWAMRKPSVGGANSARDAWEREVSRRLKLKGEEIRPRWATGGGSPGVTRGRGTKVTGKPIESLLGEDEADVNTSMD